MMPAPPTRLGNRRGTPCDDGKASCHRLDDRCAESLVLAHADVGAGCRVDPVESFVAHRARKRDGVADSDVDREAPQRLLVQLEAL